MIRNKYISSLLIFFMILTIQNNLSAQDFSSIQPVKTFWIADGDTISTDQAIKGISIPNNLEFVMQFKKKRPNADKAQRFEFKWARRGATKMYITNSFVRELKIGENTIQSGRENLKSGWWMVEIQAYSDRKIIKNKTNGEFWILIK